MERNLFKTGNSVVVSLPREILEDLNLKDGEKVNLELDRKQHRVILTPIKKERLVPADVDAQFARQVDEFISEYRPALEELAK